MHMIYPINALPRALPLCLGVQTEYGARPISIDVSAWVGKWPDIVVSVQPVRPGESDAYSAVDVKREGNVITWTPNAYDTEIPGTGSVEIIGLAEGVKIIRTGAATSIEPTKTMTSKPPEEPLPSWVDSVIRAGEQAKVDADRAEAAKEAVLESEQTVTTMAENASKAAADAQNSQYLASRYTADARLFMLNAQSAEMTATSKAGQATSSAAQAQASMNQALSYASLASTHAQNAEAAAEAAEKAAARAEAAAGGGDGGLDTEDRVDITDLTKTVEAHTAAIDELTAQKLDKRLGSQYAGRLLYVDGDGYIVPLAIGQGLVVQDGVLRVINGGGESSVEFAVDADGGVLVRGVIFVQQEDGSVLWDGATFTTKNDGSIIVS